MRKLITIFLAFSLLITVFTVNTFAENKSSEQNNAGPQTEVLDDTQTIDDLQNDLESVSQSNNVDMQEVPVLQNDISALPSTLDTEAQLLSDDKSELIEYTVEQVENGDIVLTFDSAEHAKLVGWVSFEEVLKTRGVADGASSKNLIYEDEKVIVKYDIVANVLQLKKGSTYKVNLNGNIIDHIDRTPKELTLTSGVEPWTITATVDENSNLILLSNNEYVNNHVDYVTISSDELYEGYDCYVIFQGGELIAEDKQIYVLGDYIKTLNLKNGVNYSVRLTYSELLNGEYVSNTVTTNNVCFDYEQIIGPELNAYVDDGILFIESQNEEGAEFLNALYDNRNYHFSDEVYFMLSINGDNRGYHICIRDYFEKNQKGMQVSLSNFLDDNETIDYRDDYEITLRTPGKGLSRVTFAIDENSMKLDSTTITQNTNGDINISSNIDLKFSNVTQINFRSEDSEYYDSIYPSQFTVTDNKIHIPYVAIEKSDLKENHGYQVVLIYESNPSMLLNSSFTLLKGSQKKDLPDFTAIQDKDGNIVLDINDESFIENIKAISFNSVNNSTYAYFEVEQLKIDSANKTQFIPYETIQKSQLTPGLYEIMFHYIDSNKYYFNGYSRKQINVDLGTTLSEIPEFNIHQEDNGDIVISSESNELISLINKIWYYPLNNQRAGGGYYLSENEYVKKSNSITVPYSTVLLSNFKSNTNHSFTIGLSSNKVFKYDFEDLNKEVMIYKGSILEDISVEQTDGGDIVFTFGDDSLASTIFEVLETIKIQHNSENGRYGAYVDKEYIKLIDNKMVISYDYVEESNLKENLEYTVYFNFLHELPNRLNISKGTIKKDLIIDSIIQDDDGNLVITTQSEDFINKVSEIGLNNIDHTLNVSFSSKDMVRSSNTVTIPYETIMKSQLVEGRYAIYFWYDGLYDEYIIQQKDYLVISKGSKLSKFPAYNISQNDNGDIIVESESKELIDHIKSIGYSKTDTRAGGYLPFTSFIKSDNKLVIPYQSVKYSSLEPDNTYVFSLQLDDDSIFLYDETLNKEVYIKIGSILTNLETMSIGTEYNVISINFDDQDYLKKLEDGTYSLTYYVWDSIEKENIISKDSIVFDYSENKIYLTNEFLAEKDYILNLMEKETYVAYGVAYIFGVPLVETEKANEKLDLDKMKADSASYLEKLYPNRRITVDNVYVSYSYDVLDTDADKYFKVYGLSPNNAFVIDVSMYANYKTGASRKSETVPYDYPDNPVTLELSFNLDQMAKLGITKDNYRSQSVSVLREHNGKVDELAATVEPITVNGTIISFKVTFKTDKMSLFALANKNSIVRPSSGGSGNGSSSIITIPTKKPVVNTSAK